MSGFLIRIDLMRIRLRIRIQDFFYIRDVFSCQICRYRTFFLYSGCVFLSKSTVTYLFSLFGTCFLVKYAGTVPFFLIRNVFSCQKVRYRTFFLYSGRVFLSNMPVPYLFSLFVTCFLVKKYGTVPFFFIRDVFSCQICQYSTFFLYSGRVFLSKSTVPYLFSLSGSRV